MLNGEGNMNHHYHYHHQCLSNCIRIENEEIHTTDKASCKVDVPVGIRKEENLRTMSRSRPTVGC